MINLGKELLRISPKDARKLEYSTNDGHTWITRCSSSSSTGEFVELMDNGKELLAQTTKGLFFSRNDGRTWTKRS